MKVALDKSSLVNFKHGGQPDTTPLVLGSATLEPELKVQLLGIWLERRLSWKAHAKALRGKLETQILALTRLAASVWGCDLARARMLFTAVVRPLMTYGAGVVGPSISKELAVVQNHALRCVAGAYKASPVTLLESELGIPPLELYLASQHAAFEGRLRDSGLGDQIQRAAQSTAAELRRQHALYRPPPELYSSRWPDGTTKTLLSKWREVWHTRFRLASTAAEAAGPPDLRPRALYRGLRKEQSSILFQARTGCIGLRAFLSRMKVPDYELTCPCNLGDQTVEHLLLQCQDARSGVLRALGISSLGEAWRALSAPRTASRIANALLGSGWLPEYRIAEAMRLRSLVEEQERAERGAL